MSKLEIMDRIRHRVAFMRRMASSKAPLFRGENSIAIDPEPRVVVMARRVRWARKVMAHAADFGPRTVARAAVYLAEARVA
jgi:hypothetical protein